MSACPAFFWSVRHRVPFELRVRAWAVAVICRTPKKNTNSLVISSAFAAVVGGDEFCSGVDVVGVVGSTGCTFGAAQIGNVRVASEDDWAA